MHKVERTGNGAFSSLLFGQQKAETFCCVPLMNLVYRLIDECHIASVYLPKEMGKHQATANCAILKEVKRILFFDAFTACFIQFFHSKADFIIFFVFYCVNFDGIDFCVPKNFLEIDLHPRTPLIVKLISVIIKFHDCIHNH